MHTWTCIAVCTCTYTNTYAHKTNAEIKALPRAKVHNKKSGDPHRFDDRGQDLEMETQDIEGPYTCVS